MSMTKAFVIVYSKYTVKGRLLANLFIQIKNAEFSLAGTSMTLSC